MQANNYIKLYKNALVLFIMLQIFHMSSYTGIGFLNKYEIRNIGYGIILFILLFLFFVRYTKLIKKTELIICFTLLILSLTVFISNKYDIYWLIIMSFLILGIPIDIDEVLINIRNTYIICIFTIIMLSFLGVLDNTVMMRGDGSIRFSLGFNHVNGLGAVIMELCLLLLSTNSFKTNAKLVCFFIGSAIFCWVVPNSRTCSLLIFSALVIYFYIKNVNKFPAKQFVKWLFRIFIVTIPIITVIISSIYDNSSLSFSNLNEILSGRLYYGSLFLQEYPITLFGTEIKLFNNADAFANSTSYMFLDCAYIYIGIKYGIIVLTLLLIGSFKVIKLLMQTDRYEFLTCFAINMLYGVVELGYFSLELNFTLLFFLFLLKKRYIWNKKVLRINPFVYF